MKAVVLRRTLLAATAAFIVTLIVIGVGRDRGPHESPLPSPSDFGEAVTNPEMIAKGFLFVGTDGGRPRYRVIASNVVDYDEGWLRLKDVRLTIFDEAGVGDTIIGSEARVHQERKIGEITGKVRLDGGDGMTIVASRLDFNLVQRTVNFPGTVRATLGATALVAGRALLAFESQSYVAEGGVRAVTADERGEIVLAARRADFDRRLGITTLTGEVRLSNADSWLQADNLRMTETPEGGRQIAITGTMRGTMRRFRAATAGAAAGEWTTAIGAETVELELAPGGDLRRVHFVSSPGRTVILDAAARSGLRRVIGAEGWLEFAADWPASLRVEQGFDALEQLPNQAQRHFVGERTTARWNPGDEEPRSWETTGGFRFAEGLRELVGERLFDEGPNGFARASGEGTEFRDERMIASGPEIAYRRSDGQVRMDKGSRGRLTPGEATADLPFGEKGEPVYWLADRLEANQLQQRASLLGKVRVWQGENFLKADRLELDQRQRAATALGAVQVTVPEQAGRVSGFATADRLVFRDLERVVHLLGHARLEDGTGRRIRAESVTLCLGLGSEVERILAEGNVDLADRESGLTGGGDALDHFVIEDRLFLTGQPAWAKEKSGNQISGAAIAVEGQGRRVRVISGTDLRTKASLSEGSVKKD